jgi:voltage-gated sodium channel
MIKRVFLNDKFILALIILNTVIIFIGGYATTAQEKTMISIADNFLTTMFIIELVVKSRTNGFKHFIKSNWNKLDFFLIVISIPALVTFVFDIKMLDISFLLIFRTLRIFKVFRFVKFIPNISQLFAGLQRALQTSIFVIAGFITYIFIIGILSYNLFNNSGTEYFSTPMMSLYSVFKIFTVEGWFEIPETIIQNAPSSSPFLIYSYFIIIVLTGGIFGLSIVNSIFVDSMLSDNNKELEKKINNLDRKITELLNKIQSDETS